VHLVTAAVMFGVAAVQIRRDGGLYDSLGELSLNPWIDPVEVSRD